MGRSERSGELANLMNLVKDVTLELPLPRLIEEAQRAISAQLRDFTRLGPRGLFETVPEYPPFAWQEALVNAVCVNRCPNSVRILSEKPTVYHWWGYLDRDPDQHSDLSLFYNHGMLELELPKRG